MPRDKGQKKRAEQIRSTNWVFTLNTPTEEESDGLAHIVDMEGSNIAFIAFSEETGKKRNRLHLQGYIQTKTRGIFNCLL